MISNQELINLVNETLDELYIKERFLFENTTCERNLVFHFSRYFIEKIKNEKRLNGYNVDCEYNRNKFNIKKIFNENAQIYPDFILHKRGTNKSNVLAIEFKKLNYFKQNFRDSEKDKAKLKFLTNNSYNYRYQLGLLIVLTNERNSVIINKYINGIEVNLIDI